MADNEEYVIEKVNINEYAQQLVDVAHEQGEDPTGIAFTYLRLGSRMLEIIKEGKS